MNAPESSDLVRELEFYRRHCAEMGARIFRLQLERGRAQREAWRSRMISTIISHTFQACESTDTPEEIARLVLDLILGSTAFQRGLILHRDPDGTRFDPLAVLGTRIEELPAFPALDSPPESYMVNSLTPAGTPTDELRRGVGTRFLVWSFDPRSGYALALGSDSESFAQKRLDEDILEVAASTLQVFVDIAAHKSAELALRASEEQNRVVFENAAVAMALVDRDGRYIRVNDRLNAFLGYAPGELANADKTLTNHPDDLPEASERHRALWEGGQKSVSVEKRFLRKDGSVAWGNLSASLVRDGRGKPLYVVLVIEDITHRKRVEAALRSAKEKAERESLAKSAFLASMSHELRTPLNSIIGFSEIIESELFGPIGMPRYVEYAGHIRASGQHLLDIIGDILDLSKIESGHAELEESDFRLEPLVESAVLLVHERAARLGLAIDVSLPVPVPGLHGDERAVKQMLLNLLSNSVKFTPPGGTISISATRRENGALALSVADTGIGIDEKDRKRVLEPFNQIQAVETRSHGGSGLGLSLVKAMIELHGGHLEMDSAVGTGTTVTLVFPPGRVLEGHDDPAA